MIVVVLDFLSHRNEVEQIISFMVVKPSIIRKI
jgi:hypothetical protein